MNLNRIMTLFAGLLLVIVLAIGSAGGADAPAIAERPKDTWILTVSQLDQLLRHADVAVDVNESAQRRVSAVIKIGETRSRYGRPALLAVLHRRESDRELWQIRHFAARALAKIDDPCVVEDLMDLLLDKDYIVAVAAEKGLEEITRREGKQERLPSDPASPARVEIQENWRLWWKMNQHRFVSRHHSHVPEREIAKEMPKENSKPVPSPVIVGYMREYLDSDQKWIRVKDGDVTWSHERVRWIPLFSNLPNVKQIRWLGKDAEAPNQESTPWKEFARSEGARPAEGEMGVGIWSVTFEVEFQDGSKAIFEHYPEW